MPESDANSYSDDELVAEFDRLFPQGFAGPDVLHELAPEGWEKSPLLAVFHPSLEQVYEETVRVHRNSLKLRKPDDDRSAPPEPTRDEVAAGFRETPVDPARELRELVGRCVWDVFSDNHEVVAAGGRLLDLGSFRAAGGFLADLLNRHMPPSTRPPIAEDDVQGFLDSLMNRDPSRYDYLDFYLGTVWVADRADLGPVYGLIFRRLRGRGHDWVYHFPRIYAVDLSPLKEALDRKDKPEWEDYDPSEALAKEEQKRQHEEELTEMRASLDEGYREAIEVALTRPPPATVRAYQAVYGRDPDGWPPEPSDI